MPKIVDLRYVKRAVEDNPYTYKVTLQMKVVVKVGLFRKKEVWFDVPLLSGPIGL